MKSKLEIIEETAKAYTSENRSITDGNRCVYLGPEGKRCAFSRCCKDDPRTFEILLNNQRTSAADLLEGYDEKDLLKPEYRGYNKGFWSRIQTFHDCEENWNENGLSETGECIKESLLNIYKSE